MRAGGMMVSGSEGDSGECRRDKASVRLTIAVARTVGDGEIESCEE